MILKLPIFKHCHHIITKQQEISMLDHLDNIEQVFIKTRNRLTSLMYLVPFLVSIIKDHFPVAWPIYSLLILILVFTIQSTLTSKDSCEVVWLLQPLSINQTCSFLAIVDELQAKKNEVYSSTCLAYRTCWTTLLQQSLAICLNFSHLWHFCFPLNQHSL